MSKESSLANEAKIYCMDQYLTVVNVFVYPLSVYTVLYCFLSHVPHKGGQYFGFLSFSELVVSAAELLRLIFFSFLLLHFCITVSIAVCLSLSSNEKSNIACLFKLLRTTYVYLFSEKQPLEAV